MRTKVEEESWWVEPGAQDIVLRSSSGSAARFGGRLAPDVDRERAMLAAQAPSMARLLVRLLQRGDRCICCGRDVAPGHECELTAMLKRAGVVR